MLHFCFLLQKWLQSSTSLVIDSLYFWFYCKTGCNLAIKLKTIFHGCIGSSGDSALTCCIYAIVIRWSSFMFLMGYILYLFGYVLSPGRGCPRFVGDNNQPCSYDGQHDNNTDANPRTECVRELEVLLWRQNRTIVFK